MRVLEFGSGALRNAAWLQQRGLRVDVVEFPSVIARYDAEYKHLIRRGGKVYTSTPRRQFDAVVCTFVLGTITPSKARVSMLAEMRDCLKAKAPLILAVRGPGDVKTKNRQGQPWRDGFLTPNGTFIKPFRKPELIDLCSKVGLQLSPLTRDIQSNSGIVDLILELSNE
ncbi:MAG: methyltransferase domain-containing protein [Phycisphaeraceae bacterium]|nr:methyltransferase domain-containing protein [Phycisphaerales bacterium]MCA9307546.1 methyltransferase domain-containing protein [Phycisphaerales bacterium]MCB9843684.1 methyltransferase domain-containing protein [Phycisphaeraceae bacterium]